MTEPRRGYPSLSLWYLGSYGFWPIRVNPWAKFLPFSGQELRANSQELLQPNRFFAQLFVDQPPNKLFDGLAGFCQYEVLLVL